ncbi:MAG: divalent metal cation transporter [Deltaproteobacteria bacterium]|nr:MAG: divalent metal cation transporter [Deltaproteobacteria bacterium]
MEPRQRTFWQAFGPGVLFAGAAVGVSHLVQSTRAGASFGFALAGVVVVANLAKYPAFRFGPEYAAATGTSLLEGYRRRGRWALALYAALTVGTMFTVQAAVTIVTAGLAKVLFGLDASAGAIAAALTAVCAGLLAAGRYRWLDRIGKWVVAVLTVSTVAATALALGRIDWGAVPFWPDRRLVEPASLAFVAALIGWMPSAIDVAVWQSLWTLARERDTGHRPTRGESLLDFHIGYIGTAVLALCFVTLGAAVMYGRGVAFASTAGGFAAQVIALYTDMLGEWAEPIIGAAAFSVMFSTTLTVVDGFPRALSVLVERFRGPEAPGSAGEGRDARGVYWAALAVLGVGSVVIIYRFLADLKALVDLATILSFLTAPVLAWLNHRCITGAEVPEEARPSRALAAASWAGIAFLAGAALLYLYVRFA